MTFVELVQGVLVSILTKHCVWIALLECTAAMVFAVVVHLVNFPIVLVPLPALIVWWVPIAMPPPMPPMVFVTLVPRVGLPMGLQVLTNVSPVQVDSNHMSSRAVVHKTVLTSLYSPRMMYLNVTRVV